MSLIATKPSASRTWSPSLNKRQKRQSSGSENPLLGDRRRAHAHELPDASVDEPRRVVVAVAAARAIDQNDVFRAELRAPALEAGLVRESAQPAAPLLLDLWRNRVFGRGPGSRTRRVRKDVHLRDPGRADDPN